MNKIVPVFGNRVTGTLEHIGETHQSQPLSCNALNTSYLRNSVAFKWYTVLQYFDFQWFTDGGRLGRNISDFRFKADVSTRSSKKRID